MCQEQVEELPSILTQKIGVLAHASRSCGPVYDITAMSPVEKIMWFMREIDDNGKSKKA